MIISLEKIIDIGDLFFFYAKNVTKEDLTIKYK